MKVWLDEVAHLISAAGSVKAFPNWLQSSHKFARTKRNPNRPCKLLRRIKTTC